MSDLQIFQNDQFGEIRTVMIDDEPWFVGKDVASALGYKDTADAIKKHVDEDDKGVCDLPTPGGLQKVTIINESGVYSLVFSSKLHAAKDFQRWVTHDVLPSIRKTGSYVVPHKSANELILMIAQSNVKMEQDIRNLQEQTTALTTRLDSTMRLLQQPSERSWKVDTELAIRELSTSPRFRGKLYSELEAKTGCNLKSRVNRARLRLRQNGATFAQAMAFTKLDAIALSKPLRTAFDGIIRYHQAIATMGVESEAVDVEFAEVAE